MPTNNNILDTKLGFKRGNLFNNLYDEYKNYKPQELKANNEKEDLLLQIDEQRFAMIEMNLYLDLYPNNKEALNRFNTYLKKEKELVTLYESKYGPLTTSSPVQTNNWTWNNSPWPWEVQS
ncbi:MAG: spore coat protein CotJB [Bacilli bacterium]